MPHVKYLIDWFNKSVLEFTMHDQQQMSTTAILSLMLSGCLGLFPQYALTDVCTGPLTNEEK